MTEEIKLKSGFEEAKKLFDEFHFTQILKEIEFDTSDDKESTLEFLKEEFKVSEEVLQLLNSSS